MEVWPSVNDRSEAQQLDHKMDIALFWKMAFSKVCVGNRVFIFGKQYADIGLVIDINPYYNSSLVVFMSLCT
jgi:hypothetical protein